MNLFIKVDDETHKKLKTQAIWRGKTLTELVNEIIGRWLDRMEKQTEKQELPKIRKPSRDGVV